MANREENRSPLSSTDRRFVDEDESFLALFKGKYSVSDKGEGWKQSLAWLSSGDGRDAKKKALTCVIFFVHPLRWLDKGFIKKDGMITESPDGFRGVSEQVLMFLPTHEGDVEIENAERRASAFRAVNFSSVRRVALMALQVLPERSIIAQWIVAHGGRPSNLRKKPEEGKSAETNRIFNLNILEFQSEYRDHLIPFQKVLLARD